MVVLPAPSYYRDYGIDVVLSFFCATLTKQECWRDGFGLQVCLVPRAQCTVFLITGKGHLYRYKDATEKFRLACDQQNSRWGETYFSCPRFSEQFEHPWSSQARLGACLVS